MSRISEKELALHVIDWLIADGWEVFQEVQCNVYGRRADIYARRNGITCAIETKTTFNFKVIEQARDWTNRAHYAYVAVPFGRDMRFPADICKSLGIGVITVNTRQPSAEFRVTVYSPASLHRRATLPELYEEQKTWASAGSKGEKYYTPFKATVDRLTRLVVQQPGVTMRDAIRQIQHHYASDKSAIGALVQWIRAGKVKGLRVDGRPLRLYPMEAV